MTKVFPSKFPAGLQGNQTDGYYMDSNLASNLHHLKVALKKDWDGLVVVDGIEGGGKSVLAQQAAYYCDCSLTLDRIVFNPEEFRKAVLNAQPGQAVVYDEAFGGLSSKKTMSETNHIIVSMLSECRQKNLFLFIVLPTFFDLDKYVSLWRSRALIHVVADKFERGYFKFYNYAKKKQMFVLGKKFYNYKCVKPDFFGRFTDFYPVGKEEYKKKKRDSLKSYIPTIPKGTDDIKRSAYIEVVRNMYYEQKIMKLTRVQIASLVGLTRQTVTKYLETEL